MQKMPFNLMFIFLIAAFLIPVFMSCTSPKPETGSRAYNGPYTDAFNTRVAWPIGGIGAGMICLEGRGAISHVSVRNRMEFFNEPCTFAAVTIKGENGSTARILEGPVPEWKTFGGPRTGNGAGGTSYGLPRFKESEFLARFPFGTVTLGDPNVPLEAVITGWSPFIPGDADNASLPVGTLEYSFKNPTGRTMDVVFSYNSKNFMSIGNEGHTVKPIKNGFVLWQEGTESNPENKGAFAVFVDDDNAVVDHCWFKGGWWDAVTLAWKNIESGVPMDNPPVEGTCPGASLFVPFTLEPGGEKTVRLMIAWYVPETDLRLGTDPDPSLPPAEPTCCESGNFVPWYAGRFSDIYDVAEYWRFRYDDLRQKTKIFTDTFYDTDLPAEVIEAAAANLTILKSPTVLRQKDGRFWCFEGCSDNRGCCHGSCTHVWNYAQAIPHLFPSLERSLRETEFLNSQDERGHQTFRTPLPIRPPAHDYHAASDGQLGGIMKVFREWRISGDTDWLKSLWPRVRQSLDYCIRTWDPKGKGLLEEPHHNTYDIEYWGPDGHCSSFYLGALDAAVKMGEALEDDIGTYAQLLEKGKAFYESELYNGEYFIQKIQTEGLETEYPGIDYSGNGSGYRKMIDRLNQEGPKYQYGTGCLSDGVLGFWIGLVCGLDETVDSDKITSHLLAVHKYNLKRDLADFANPQRPSFAMGNEGGLLLCTWPRGGELSLPFVYSNEVWTGIEYQVASHLMFEGKVKEGLDIVRECRDRYDGRIRNPFNEYECGHWYGRALSSYGLIQGLTGVRYDAVEKTLYINSRMGDSFRSFLAVDGGFGTVGLKNGKPFLDVKMGKIEVERTVVSDQEAAR
ncbi:MAG: non-lysosomal glucosylceramidase [Candidatus Aminicenantes bacterium]|nr:non-lysosomal glucosylceramidase [Candidatus Aminicenantes bacterium]